MSLKRLLREVRACRICEADLPFGPRPVLQLASTARLLIIGQAPGSKVHQTGIPWNDASGDRLRDWLKLDRSVFYDAARVAILPMGFCYPGAGESGGDKPPRPECAPLWHTRLLKHLPEYPVDAFGGSIRPTTLFGIKAKGFDDGDCQAFSEYAPQFFPLPHPSWRSVIWMRKHPWFEETAIPEVRKAVRKLI